jgi:hypothetical protein
MSWAKGAASLVMVLSLAGCSNWVMSETPLLGPSDALSPGLREGVWVLSAPNCATSDPPVLWADCTTTVTVHGSGRLDAPYDLPAFTYQLAGEDALVLQVAVPGVRPSYESMRPLFDREAYDRQQPVDPASVYYSYWRIETLARDSVGLITDLAMRTVECGPPRKSNEAKGGTRKPLPGLAMDGEGESCTPQDKAALFNAASHTTDWPPSASVDRYRWLRPLTTEEARAPPPQSTIAE